MWIEVVEMTILTVVTGRPSQTSIVPEPAMTIWSWGMCEMERVSQGNNARND
jgi:hypothetical protein